MASYKSAPAINVRRPGAKPAVSTPKQGAKPAAKPAAAPRFKKGGMAKKGC